MYMCTCAHRCYFLTLMSALRFLMIMMIWSHSCHQLQLSMICIIYIIISVSIANTLFMLMSNTHHTGVLARVLDSTYKCHLKNNAHLTQNRSYLKCKNKLKLQWITKIKQSIKISVRNIYTT